MKEVHVNRIARALGAIGLAIVWVLPAVAADVPTGPTSPKITPAELTEELAKPDPDVVVLDVRTPEEFAAGHVPGARNIPHGEIQSRLAELADARGKKVVLYCRSGRRVSLAEAVLSKEGFTRLQHLEGDWPAWEAQKRPVAK
jgi:phage shock protein E